MVVGSGFSDFLGEAGGKISEQRETAEWHCFGIAAERDGKRSGSKISERVEE